LEKAFAAEPMNFETAYNLGEAYRVESFNGGRNCESLAKTAMEWFARGMKLNPHDAYNYLRYGMCLDWLGHPGEAGPYFDRADALDPNGYYTTAIVGWHHVQAGNYAAARPWLWRSLRLHGQGNLIASSYLDIAERKMAGHASGTGALPAGF
jgi:tetratricopeptide (TPR) repeat protein